MKLTPRISEAINYASKLHCKQFRKGNPTLPYISHLFAVACIVSEYTDDEDVIIAGLLHDSLEDVEGYTYEQLESDFGRRVADIVKDVSECKTANDSTDKKLTWEERKQKYIEHLQTAGADSLIVCGADKIHNAASYISDYKATGPSMWERFNASPEKKIAFYSTIAGILKTRLDNDMGDRIQGQLDILKSLLPVEAEINAI